MGPTPCDVCKGLDASISIDHGVPLPQIRQSFGGTWLSRGCQRCGLLLRAILALKDAVDDEKDMLVGWDTNRLDGLRVVVKRVDAELLSFSVDLFCHPGDRPPWVLKKHGETARDISGDTGSNAAISQVTRWIQDCEKNHSCKGSGPDRYFPTRVLDITNVQAIRLHHTTGDEEGGYACLSHCWGTTRFLTTTTVNIESHQTTIPWDKLPPSFQDAITIAHKLSVPYLWIDSLCIIQDSQEDWQAESTQMASIYANGKITLAATMSASDIEGFSSLAPKLNHSQKLRYRSDSGASETIHFRQTLTHGYGPDPGPSPLLTRGWVLQERLLSPRVVHFTRDELIWECMEKTTCECGCIRSLWVPGWVPFNKDLLYEPNLARASKAELTENWHQIVEQYSRLDLSFSRDRVPAISGAARRMSPYRNSRYFVGMWENSLIKDLMWARKGRLETTRRLGRVPTWSWVSIDSQVTYDEAISTTELAVVTCVEQLRSGQDEDEASNTNLMFLTRELNARNEMRPLSDEFTQTFSTVTISGFLINLHEYLFGDKPHTFINAHDSKHPYVELEKLGDLILDVKEDAGDCCLSHVYCLQLAIRKGVIGGGDNQEVSLVLFRTDTVTQTFKRLGLLKRSFQGSVPEVDIFEQVGEAAVVHIKTDGMFPGCQNYVHWYLLLGDKAGSEDVSPYVAPRRATDLSNVPEAYLDVGTAEPFRDEAVAFASKLWECGVQAELHVWPGGTHGFHTRIPEGAVSKESTTSTLNWFKRVLVEEEKEAW